MFIREQRRWGDRPTKPNYLAAIVWSLIVTLGVVMVWGVVG